MSTREQLHKALSDLIRGRHILHIPPQETDVDIVLFEAIEELESLKGVIRDYHEALKSYDFGPGTIGHETLARHKDVVAKIIGEVE